MEELQYSYQILCQLSEKQKKEWQSLWESSKLHHFFNSLEFFESYCTVFSIKKKAIIFCYQGEELRAVLPLVEERVFGVQAYVTPGKKGNYTDKFALLAKTLEKKLLRSLLKEASQLGSVYLAEVGGGLIRDLGLQSGQYIKEWASASRWAPLSPELDVLRFMSSKQRRNLRQRIHHHEKELHFEFFETNLDQAFKTVINVEKGSYKKKRHIALFGNTKTVEFFRVLIDRCPERIRISVLFLNKKPVATKIGLVYGSVYSLYHSAFLDYCSRWGAGKILQYFTLEHLKQVGFTRIDLLRGDSDLKRQFADDISEQYNLYLPKDKIIFIWWCVCIPIRKWLKRLKSFLV